MKKGYIDSNIFLNPILYGDKKAEAYKKILNNIINNGFYAVTSVLTWDEVVFIIGKKIGRDLAVKEGRKFLAFPNLFFVSVSMDIVLRAQKIIEKYNLKPRDAIHIATALSQGCNEIVSDDADFDKVKEIKRVGF
ncbi:type II toxin-antitoxin system VapC family toxin [Candidatus Pacearchaeota archaeon]|nr:type II toxin-antitoxin system VapC family toxin [Candidatus Pacearchaeota archaeon]